MHLGGRVLFATFFVLFGLLQLFNLRASVEYLQRKQIPGPRPVSLATGLMLLIGGVFVLLGWHRFIGAGLLFLVLVPGAWALYPFWREGDPVVRRDQMALFFMMLSLAGAALLIGYYGGPYWPLSVGH